MDKTTFFIAVTSVAVILQMVILAAMFFTMRASGMRMEALAAEIRGKALPALDQANVMLTELRPQLNTILENVNHSTALVRGHMTRLDATLHDVLDRTRLQVIRTDELVTKTLDRVEDATDAVHGTVMTPVRQLSGIMHGISVGLGFLVGGKSRNGRETVGVPRDEMFI
jgi:hypothetical protein